jgi:predicted Zn-dependent protease
MPGTVAAGLADEHAIEAFFEAIRNFESVAGSEPASRAWRAATERWPEEAMPFVALGNTAYAQQRLHDAADWYSRGRSGSPENLVLLNNLASVLGELGCAHKAIELLVPAEKSMSEATVWGSAVRKTLDELESQQGDDELSCGRW